MDHVDEIRSKLNIEDVVAQYVPLKRVGRNFKGLCPFHNEKTPSFIVSPEKGLAYCFGCNRGGDVFRFVQEVEGLDFISALKVLAEKANVQLPQKFTPVFENKDERERLYQIHDAAAAFFEKKLWDTKDGEKVLTYLRKKRELKDETIRKFRVGFAPDEHKALSSELLSQGFSRAELVKAGVSGAADTGADEVYDRFRGRLIFPIKNHAGRICAFGGRALADGQEPKYLNSPDTTLYHKERLMYGLDEAKVSIRKLGYAVVMEGYMDVIQSSQCGIENIVASSGTAFSVHHAELLKRFTKNLVLFFDADTAGKTAAKRALPIAQRLDFDVKILTAKEGKDPDEWLKTKPDDVKSAIESAPSYMDFYFSEISSMYNLSDISDQKKALEEILPVIRRVINAVEKDHYVRRLASLLKIRPELVYTELARAKDVVEQMYAPKASQEAQKPQKTQLPLAEYMLGYIIHNIDFLPKVKGKVTVDDLPTNVKDIYKRILDFYNLTHEHPDRSGSLEMFLSPELREKANLLALYVESQVGALNAAEMEKEFDQVLKKFLDTLLSDRKRRLLDEMKTAEMTGDTSKAKDILATYNSLITTYGQEN
ncbi:MAG: DNA primase [Patescibacteria group bacterium]